MLYALFGWIHAAAARRARAIVAALEDQRGQGTVEYVGLILLVSLLMVGMVAAMKGFNGKQGTELAEVIVEKIKSAVNTRGSYSSNAIPALPSALRADDRPERGVVVLEYLVVDYVGVPGAWTSRRSIAHDLPVAREVVHGEQDLVALTAHRMLNRKGPRRSCEGEKRATDHQQRRKSLQHVNLLRDVGTFLRDRGCSAGITET
jgi:hypothetical protein